MQAPRQRRLTASRVARLAMAVLIGATLGLAIDVVRSGGPAGWLARRGATPPYDARGRQVAVDAAGRTAYLDCRGAGSPTIVFEAGAGTGADGWGFVLDEAAAMSRACAWDRPGIGRSPGRDRHSAADTGRDLRAALAAAGERPPFIVVGHSLGGVYARIFVHAHRAEVDSLLLLDPYTPDLAPVDVVDVPPDFRAGWHEAIDATNRQVADAEGLDWAATERELRAASLGDVPLELLFVDQHYRYPETLDPAVVEGLIAAWESLALGLSDRARLSIAHGSGHVIQLDRPDLVIEAIRRLVDGSRGTAVSAAIHGRGASSAAIRGRGVASACVRNPPRGYCEATDASRAARKAERTASSALRTRPPCRFAARQASASGA
jgi:pimeloyl-ACP methyl ester carboxylesterase